MKLAVFGAAGQLGAALARVGEHRGVAVIGFHRAGADIADAAAVGAALVEADADVAVNAAAYTAVDKAESEPEMAFAVNRDGAANVAAAAAHAGIPVIHISTDYVFDGTKAAAYVEDDPIAPVGIYGRSKAEGEAAVCAANPHAVILRTAWVYGVEGANFVKTMLRLGAERDVLRIVDDQRGCPTFADDLAGGIVSVAGNLGERWGTYHLSGGGETTWFGFAGAIFAEAARLGARTPRLEPITTADYPTPAKRPANSVLDCTKAKRTFGVELPPWNDGLSRMLRAHLGAK
jgi:dTDP-4-dehydrorhamnose reductase